MFPDENGELHSKYFLKEFSSAALTAELSASEVEKIEERIKKLTQLWPIGPNPENDREIQTLRRKLILNNHKNYYQNIPRYRLLCDRQGVGPHSTLLEIVNRTMVTDDLFKSYPQNLIEKKDFNGMNSWIRDSSTVTNSSTYPASHSKVNSDVPFERHSEVQSIDQWIAELEKQNVHLVFSSGTSGHMSFVPRDLKTWKAFLELPYLYLPQVLASRRILPKWKQFAVRILAKLLSPKSFLNLIKKVGMSDLDGFFLNFSGGNQGIQLVGREAGKLTRTAHFLYQIEMSANAVRALVRGPKTQDEKEAVMLFLSTTVHKKEENYSRILSELSLAVRLNKKIMLFGTPYLLKELCEKAYLKSGSMTLPRGSHVIYGGGWKSFDGKRIPEEQLIALISNTFGISASHVLEGYSMTEINGLMPKCAAGKFHIPPYMEALTFDEKLNPQFGPDSAGSLGILDPFAFSYPGFLITGDHVMLSSSPCSCGLSGQSISKVERSPSREVKGCGGIMATVNA